MDADEENYFDKEDDSGGWADAWWTVWCGGHAYLCVRATQVGGWVHCLLCRG